MYLQRDDHRVGLVRLLSIALRVLTLTAPWFDPLPMMNILLSAVSVVSKVTLFHWLPCICSAMIIVSV